MDRHVRRRGWIGLVAICVLLDAWWVRHWWLGRREDRAEVHILDAARRYGVDPALVKAVVWRESRFREDARGGAGELGLMQVGPLAAEDWAKAERLPGFRHADLLDPQQNTRAGTWYLSRLLKRYPQADNPTAFALADYNAGRMNVLRWTRGPAATNSEAFLAAMDFPGTRAYVRSVLERWERYRREPPRASP